MLFFFKEEREHLGVVRGVNTDLDRMITEHVGTSVCAFLEMKECNYYPDEIEIIVQLYTGGVAYVVSQWLSGGKLLDIEFIAKTITDRLSLEK